MVHLRDIININMFYGKVVLAMGYVTVKFLGEEYQVSETINEFLSYDQLLSPVRTKMLNAIMADVKKDSRLSWDGNTMASHIHNTTNKYRKMMEEGTELLVKKLLKLGVYDVTSNELLKNVTSIGDINDMEKRTFSTLLEEGQRFVDMKNAGMERAYRYAASNITGSGVRIFTSSFSTLIIHSIVERSILLSQAKKADKEYEEAVRNISARTIDALDTLYREVMVKEFYPSVVQIFLEYNSKVMSAFLVELTIHEKFDFESVKKYDMRKAEQMLKNINKVPDKVAFLKQTFLICPFGLDVYEACVKYGVLDKETFETAKYFGLADELAEKIDSTIKQSLKNTEKITPLISILASHRGTDEIGIWSKIYKGTLGNIEGTYKTFNASLSDKKKLDKFIRENVNSSMKEVVKKSREDIIKCIDKKMLALISEKQYDELVGKGILSAETIRMHGSSATALNDINIEIRSSLADCIMEYIEEAKQRLDTYNKAMEVYKKELKQKEDELSVLKSEKSRLGLFAFSKKKEMTTKIDKKATEISEFKRIHEPKDLWVKFEAMYR